MRRDSARLKVDEKAECTLVHEHFEDTLNAAISRLIIRKFT